MRREDLRHATRRVRDWSLVLDDDVIGRFREGDPTAIREIYGQYGRLLFTVARRIVGTSALADEVVQESFVKAWRAASDFEATRDLAPWLVTITRRTAIDVVRREKAARREPLGDDHAASLGQLDPDLEHSDDVWAVRHAVDQLPDEERDVVRLQHLDGCSHDEVAERLGIPVGTVKSRSFRAHRRLASALGHLRGDADDV